MDVREPTDHGFREGLVAGDPEGATVVTHVPSLVHAGRDCRVHACDIATASVLDIREGCPLRPGYDELLEAVVPHAIDPVGEAEV